MKFLAASVPRSVRTAQLSHLRMDAIIGSWYIQNPGGANQVFDVVMQEEVDFIRTKNHLATPASQVSLQQGQAQITHLLKDIRTVEMATRDEAIAHFRAEFKIS